MKRELSKYPATGSIKRCRRAFGSLEVIVALTLLLSVLSLSASLIVRHGRLLVTQRHYRQALDELSNQVDRLTALPADDVPQALKQVSLSQFAATRLPGAKLTADIKPADIGQRFILRLTWKEHHEQSETMTGWILPRTSGQAEKGSGAP
jgi:hypothetical protein